MFMVVWHVYYSFMSFYFDYYCFNFVNFWSVSVLIETFLEKVLHFQKCNCDKLKNCRVQAVFCVQHSFKLVFVSQFVTIYIELCGYV